MCMFGCYLEIVYVVLVVVYIFSYNKQCIFVFFDFGIFCFKQIVGKVGRVRSGQFVVELIKFWNQFFICLVGFFDVIEIVYKKNVINVVCFVLMLKVFNVEFCFKDSYDVMFEVYIGCEYQ